VLYKAELLAAEGSFGRLSRRTPEQLYRRTQRGWIASERVVAGLRVFPILPAISPGRSQ